MQGLGILIIIILKGILRHFENDNNVNHNNVNDDQKYKNFEKIGKEKQLDKIIENSNVMEYLESTSNPQKQKISNSPKNISEHDNSNLRNDTKYKSTDNNKVQNHQDTGYYTQNGNEDGAPISTNQKTSVPPAGQTSANLAKRPERLYAAIPKNKDPLAKVAQKKPKSKLDKKVKRFSKINFEKISKLEETPDNIELINKYINELSEELEDLHVKDLKNKNMIKILKNNHITLNEQLAEIEMKLKTVEMTKERDSNYILDQEEMLAKARSQAVTKVELQNPANVNISSQEKMNNDLSKKIKQTVSERIDSDLSGSKVKEHLLEIEELIAEEKRFNSVDIVKEFQFLVNKVEEIRIQKQKIKDSLKVPSTNISNSKIVELSDTLDKLQKEVIENRKSKIDLERKLNLIKMQKEMLKENKNIVNESKADELEEQEIRLKAKLILDKFHHRIMEYEQGLNALDYKYSSKSIGQTSEKRVMKMINEQQ